MAHFDQFSKYTQDLLYTLDRLSLYKLNTIDYLLYYSIINNFSSPNSLVMLPQDFEDLKRHTSGKQKKGSK